MAIVYRTRIVVLDKLLGPVSPSRPIQSVRIPSVSAVADTIRNGEVINTKITEEKKNTLKSTTDELCVQIDLGNM